MIKWEHKIINSIDQDFFAKELSDHVNDGWMKSEMFVTRSAHGVFFTALLVRSIDD